MNALHGARTWALAFSLASLLSCRSTQSSNLESVVFTKGGQTIFVHFDNDMFFLNACKTSKEVELASTSLDPARIKSVCHDSSTPVSPQSMKNAIQWELAGPPPDDLPARKEARIKKLIERLNESDQEILELAKQFDTAGPDLQKELEVVINEAEASQKALKDEMKKLQASLSNPEELRKIDVDSTVGLEGKIIDAAADRAELFTAMLMNKRVYRLDRDRDRVFTKVLESFAPTCADGQKLGESFELQRGVEKLIYECEAGGTTKVLKTECAFEGYERIDNYCIFTGKDLRLARFGAAHFGICGVSRANHLTCWGRDGTFPVEKGPGSRPETLAPDGAVPISSITTKVFAQNLAIGSGVMCTLNGVGAIYDCWIAVDGVPAKDQAFHQVAAGSTHFCGIRPDGNISCWGDNNLRQREIPSDVKAAKQLSVFHNTSCVTHSGKKLNCWGNYYSSSGEESPSVPSDLGPVEAVSPGARHQCAILEDKTVRCWGVNEGGQTDVPADLGKVRAILSGFSETCAVTINGKLRCWGNFWAPDQYKPGPSESFSDVSKLFVSPSGENFCGIDVSGTVACWGMKLYNNYPFNLDPPTGLPKDIENIAITSSSYACGVTRGGSVHCWGNMDVVQKHPPEAFTIKKGN